jgi:hypothetical protein
VVILVVGWRMFCDFGSCCCCCLIRIRCRQSVERVHWQSNRSRPCSHRRRVCCGDTGGFEPLDVRMYFVSISRGFSFPGFFSVSLRHVCRPRSGYRRKSFHRCGISRLLHVVFIISMFEPCPLQTANHCLDCRLC